MQTETTFQDQSPEEIEEARLAALAAEALEMDPEPVFDAIANAAALMTSCPIALVSFMERDRQLFKARCGFSESGTSRDVSFCSVAVDARTVIESLDTTKDPRFKDNPFVRGDDPLMYYLGVPVRAENGQVLGTICVIDRKPRKATNPEVVEALKGLGGAIEQILRMRSVLRRQAAKLETLAELEISLEDDSSDLGTVSQMEAGQEEATPREWVSRLTREFADDEPAKEPSDTGSNQWGVVIKAGVRGLRPAARERDLDLKVDITDRSLPRPPVIFARIVFATVQDALQNARQGGEITLSVSRKAGFVLYSVTFDGHLDAPNPQLSRWMRTIGGILNIKNQTGKSSMLAWFPIT